MRFEYDEKTGVATVTGFDNHFAEIYEWFKIQRELNPSKMLEMDDKEIAHAWFKSEVLPMLNNIILNLRSQTTPPRGVADARGMTEDDG